MSSKRLAFVALLVMIPARASVVHAQDAEPAMKGYCPVSIQTLNKMILGSTAHRSSYQGFNYVLADAESKAKFDADPAKYAPQFGGFCTTALGGSYGNRLSSDPTVYRVVEGKLYLFSSERARDSFDKDPNKYITTAAERFNKPALGGNCLATYTLKGQAVPGSPKYTQQYLGVVYQFADEAAQAAFLREPEKYIPAYGGFCVDGVANEKRFPGDPKVFLTQQGRLYFFFDENAKKRFVEDPSGMIKKADTIWTTLKRAKPTP